MNAAPLDMRSTRFLITQAHLLHYMGSEVVTLELAEYLASLGADVIIATHTFGAPIRAEFDRLPVRVFEIDDPELQIELDARRPDVAWIHHHLIPEALLRDPGDCVFVFNHMSGVTPGELPLSIGVERALSSVSLFVSPEALALQIQAGNFTDFPPQRLQLWANPAPAAFASSARRASGRPRLAVVSNHIPSEVHDALPELREAFDVELIGSQRELGARPRRVTSADLAQFDAVISIGKTVQYALTAGIPVYCYDHFGGPGWITHDTIEQAARVNFSGRGASRRSAAELVAEIRDGLDRVRADAEAHREARIDAYSLPARWESLWRFLQEEPRTTSLITTDDVGSHLNTQRALTAYIRQWTLARGDADYRGSVIESLSRGLRATVRAFARRVAARPAMG